MESQRFLTAQRQLRDALEQDRALLDDADASALLASAGRGVLAVLEELLDEEAMWSRFASTPVGGLSTQEIDQLERFADGGIRALLKGLGYREPPPLDRLVDDTIESLYLAVDGHEDAAVATARVRRARADLALFAIRLRRLVGSAHAARPSLARRLLRAACREGDEVMTAATPVLIEATLTAALPGVGSLVAKLAAAAGGVLAARLGALRERRMPEASAQLALDPGELADRMLVRLRAAASAEIVDADELVLRSWIAEEALQRLHSLRPRHLTVEQGLRALRELRQAMALGDIAAARACAATAYAAVPQTVEILNWNLVDDEPSKRKLSKRKASVDSKLRADFFA